jgi:hypothetical protein
MYGDPVQAIYGGQDANVREAVQPLLGSSAITLLASAVHAVAHVLAVQATLDLPHNGFGQLVVVLDVTAALAAGGDTLDVYLDSSIDGAIWVNIAHYTQVVGGGGAKRFVSIHPRSGTATITDVTTDLVAGNLRSFIGSHLRVRETVVNAGAGAQSFTYGMTACLKP